MHNDFRTLLPGQFRISTLLFVTAIVAIVCGVIRLPSGVSEKITALMAMLLCYGCWRKRNYLHPLQGSIALASRRKIAWVDFFTSIFPFPVIMTGFYFWNDRSSHPLWFTDVVFCGSLAMLFAIACWKLKRALKHDGVWINTI